MTIAYDYSNIHHVENELRYIDQTDHDPVTVMLDLMRLHHSAGINNDDEEMVQISTSARKIIDLVSDAINLELTDHQMDHIISLLIAVEIETVRRVSGSLYKMLHATGVKNFYDTRDGSTVLGKFLESQTGLDSERVDGVAEFLELFNMSGEDYRRRINRSGSPDGL